MVATDGHRMHIVYGNPTAWGTNVRNGDYVMQKSNRLIPAEKLTYPAWEQVLPKKTKPSLTLTLTAVGAGQLCCDLRTTMRRYKAHHGMPISVGAAYLNAKYLADALYSARHHAPGNIRIEVRGVLDATRIVGDGFEGVVMARREGRPGILFDWVDYMMVNSTKGKAA